MCGIAGYVSSTAGALDKEASARLVKQMCDRIIHRGPDDFGVYSDASAAIGMRRLSIIDLETGHQPIHNEDQSVWLVFNGEIYNYRELRQDLEAAGHQFYTSSDSEVIVHAFEEYDTDCFARLRGMFAIALWDKRNNRFVLARDRFGKKPLYWARTSDGCLAFGSELKTLLPVPGIPRKVSNDAVYSFLTMGYVASPDSIFHDVKKLEPASWLELRDGKVSTGRYWQLDFTSKLQGTEGELAERLLSEIDEAVRIRLVSDVPFGAFLSGGLDSSVVVALMARNMKEPVRTFTIGFQESKFDEREDARRVATHFGTRHEELVVNPDAVDIVSKLVSFLDEPFADSSSIPTYLVADMAARHVKMVLSGDGGDEMFAGYTRYAKYLQLRKWSRMSLGTAGMLGALAGRILPGASGRRLRWVGSRMMRGFPADYITGVGLMAPEAAEAVLCTPPSHGARNFGAVAARYTGARATEVVDRICAGDMQSYMLDDILVKVDRMTMAASLEARSPLLDHKLAEFAAAVPVHLKMDRGVGKILLRRVADKLLPPECLQKRKQGFAIPLASWLRGPLKPMLMDTIGSRRFAQRGILSQPMFLEMAKQHCNHRVDYSEPLWLAMSFELWARKFLEEGG